MADYSEVSIESLHEGNILVIYLNGVFSIRDSEKEEVVTLANKEALDLADFIFNTLYV